MRMNPEIPKISDDRKKFTENEKKIEKIGDQKISDLNSDEEVVGLLKKREGLQNANAELKEKAQAEAEQEDQEWVKAQNSPEKLKEKAREVALLEDILKNTTREEYLNLINNPSGLDPRDPVFKGKLGGREVTVTFDHYSLGEMRPLTIEVDGAVVYRDHYGPNLTKFKRNYDNIKPAADKALVDKLISTLLDSRRSADPHPST